MAGLYDFDVDAQVVDDSAIGWDDPDLTAAIITATGAVSGTGTLAGTAVVTHNATGAISGTGTLSGTARITHNATGAISGSGTVTGTALVTHPASGTISGTGTLSGTATVTAGGIPHGAKKVSPHLEYRDEEDWLAHILQDDEELLVIA